jgi:AMP nucleosidase
MHFQVRRTFVKDSMKTKQDIVQNWLPRYTGEKLENFGKYILLTNFSNYVRMFSEWTGATITGIDKPMQCATWDGITIINFGMGSPTAATVMDLLTAICAPCGIVSWKMRRAEKAEQPGRLDPADCRYRGEGTSNDYFPVEVPAMPAFALQKAISTTIRDHDVDYWTGTGVHH